MVQYVGQLVYFLKINFTCPVTNCFIYGCVTYIGHRATDMVFYCFSSCNPQNINTRMCSIICKYHYAKHVLYLCCVKSFPLKYRMICKMHSLCCESVFSFHMKINFANVNSLTTKIHVKLNLQAALDRTEPLGSEVTKSPPTKVGRANQNGA